MGKNNGDIVFFALIFIVIGISWLMSTNDTSTSNSGSIFSYLVPNSSNTTGSTSTTTTIQNPRGGTSSGNSGGTSSGTSGNTTPVLKLKIDRSWSYPKATDPTQEYISIVADYKNTGRISLTGWKIQSAVSGASYSIPSGVRVPVGGQIGSPEAVTLGPGEWAIISSGRSPIGQSFLENKCTGYFAQFQNFYPGLSRTCPLPSNELPYSIEKARTYGDKCFDYLNNMGQCTVATTGSIPNTLSPQCNEFITTRMTYNGCTSAHRNDSDFFGTAWRLYLNRESEIWRPSREEIDLVSPDGVIVDSYSY